ncbi:MULTISPECIES: PLDc N-terminal domain-containing protein [Actinomycetes]|uniref:PLDc_N domain-containing protein n=3 Tax=Actinomycetes TaxID=1760 RepID=A0A7Y0UTN7_9ACTO|nr:MULTISPECIES: PLD nuclease N-terminal domain-containing protein [Actinomycetes]PLB80799.1 hypothetical protein CYJ21_00950 [Actinomyces sp. UMB0138]ARU45751.1 PLD nuclease N-terminal domain-containing protein [Corynebacterium silvaticum]MDY5133453.1 PLD nuclease N-terminal domain-containing protein [Actinotignum urinale]NMX03541.1 PLDc_N domain-containing protein [Mobiluncus mulieris]NMX10533.1 PLDc_N domain-containing protein [Mobiluncus mulieris]
MGINGVDKLLELPTPAFIGVCVLIGVHLVAMVWALLRLSRDKRSQIAGLNRLAWLCVIVFGQAIGPITFLVMNARERKQLKLQREYEQESSLEHREVDVTSVVSNLYKEQKE